MSSSVWVGMTPSNLTPRPSPSDPEDLIQLDRARDALAKASSLDEVWKLHGLARATHLAARRRGARRAARAANAIRFDAERRMGEITRGLPKKKGGRPRERNRPPAGEGFDGQTKSEALRSLGIRTQRASDFEAMARVPLDVFKAEAAKPDATTRALARLGRQYNAEGERKEETQPRERKPPTFEEQIERIIRTITKLESEYQPGSTAIEMAMLALVEAKNFDLADWRPLIEASRRRRFLASARETLRSAVPLEILLPAAWPGAVEVGAAGYVHQFVEHLSEEQRGGRAERSRQKRERLTLTDAEIEAWQRAQVG